jgi:hypothetical protein
MTTAIVNSTLPASITALIFRSDVVGGDPDHVVGLAGEGGKISTGWVRESGCRQIELLRKPKYILSLEERGYEFGLTQSGDIGAWLDGAPCSRFNDFSWRWCLDERLYLTACFWQELQENE